MWSVKCRVRSEEWKVVECSVKCGVWSVKSQVRSEECKVQSVKCGV